MPKGVKSHGLRGFSRRVRRPARRPRRGGWKKKVNGRRTIRSLKRTKMGRTGLQAALALKTLKKHEPSFTNNLNWETSVSGLGQQLNCNRFQVFHPFDLDRISTRSEEQRECDNIYLFNSRGEFEINAGYLNIDGFEVRMIKGYSRGVPDLANTAHAKTPIEACLGPYLSSQLQHTEDKLNSDYYHIISDKVYTFRPANVLPGRVVTRAATAAELVVNYMTSSTFAAELLQGHWIDSTLKTHNAPIPERAIWTPKRLKFNMHFNKKIMYDGDKGTDCIGNIPFVAIGLYKIRGSSHEMAASANVGHQVILSPQVTLDYHTFFKDC